MNQHATNPPLHHRYAPLAFLGALALVASSVAADRLSDGFSGVLSWWLSAGWPALLYCAACIGLGRLFRAPLTRWGLPRELESALGLVTQLWLSNFQLSFIGGLGVDEYEWTFRISLVPGLVGFVLLFLRRSEQPRLSPWRLLAFAPAGFLLAAACAPPGWLFGSEGGGYDSLSYHLQLPQEWIVSRSGCIEPLTHNLFSYFPNFVEGAFTHISAISGASRSVDVIGANGLVADGGWRLLTCQMLHALMAIHAAWMLGALVRVAGKRAHLDGVRIEWAVALARLLVLLTPWVIVSGSLSYNEMPMLTCIAATLIVLLHPELKQFNIPAVGTVLGVLVAGAAGAKPTGGLFLGVPAAVMCLHLIPRRKWPALGFAGAISMGIVLAPWLIRNVMAGSNPIFPFALGMFGSNHWDVEQVERFTQSVSFGGSWSDRLRLMFLADPNDPAGVVHRGLMHPQWLWFFPIAVGGLAFAFRSKLREVGVPLTVFALIQLMLWLTVTHIQSRFLLPLLPPVAAGFAIGVASLPRAFLLAIVCGIAMRGIATWSWYRAERGGQPNMFLALGPSYFTGHHAAELLKSVKTPQERDEAIAQAPPSYFARREKIENVLLVGDAAALYWTDPVYATTWDRNPLASAFMETFEQDPFAVNEMLAARGIQFVFVNEAELDRLARSELIDPALTPQRISSWLSRGVEPVRVWPELRCYLVKLKVRPTP